MLAGHPHHCISPASSSADTGSRDGTATLHPQCELDSAGLLQGRREVLIRHGGECYRLRHTRNDKLILTK